MVSSARERVAATLRAAALGAAGLLALQVWGVLLASVAVGVVGPLDVTARTVVGTAALGLGTATVAGAYLRLSERDASYVDFRRPTRRDLAYVVAGVVALLAVLVVLDRVTAALGVTPAQHSIEREARGGHAGVLLVLVPLSVLVVGPGEELLYRNVVQKSLTETFPRWRAIGIASAIFALVHVFAYSTGNSTASLATTLGIIFVLAVVLGVLYARTENTLVPALVHGTYNAVQFALLYGQLR
ncbi:MAG: lysostaphin resistance A-like protein [Halobacteriaceae archaeon]